MNESNEVVLSPAEAALFADLTQAAQHIEQQARGAFMMICRQRGLSGNWAVKGDRLVREA